MLRVLGGTLVAVTLALNSAGVSAQDEITSVNTGTDSLTVVRDNAAVRSVASIVPPGMSNLRELPAGTKTHHLSKGGSVAGLTETLIYSNTRGRVIIPLEPGFLVADDIATIAPDGCRLTKATFQVMGNANLSVGEARSYSVTYALYDTCPEAFPPGASPSRLIPGTLGTITIDANVQDVTEVTIPLSGPAGKTSMWLALTFNRDNCAVIGGAPPLEGFSGDLISFPALGCSPNLGTFPTAPHASFNVELYGDSATCPCRHIQYRNTREDGSFVNFGANQVVVDDLTLITGNCLLTGYEVALRGRAIYNIELRRGCESDPPGLDWGPNGTSAAIPGTYKKISVGASSSGTRIMTIPVDPPQLLSGTIFLAVKVNNPNGGPILTTIQAKVGSTTAELQLMDAAGGCGIAPLGVANAQGALQATLICDGCAVAGACCDMYIKECDGGLNDGEPCRFDTDCEAPGLCNAQCRELPQINCPFPQVGSLQLPAWVSEGVCDGADDPFADQFNVANKVCGSSACCFKDTDNIEKCQNLFERDCDVAGDQAEPRQWQLGQLCSQNNQSCPLIACLGREGDCKEPHFTPGCDDSACCSAVCRLPFQDFCCQFEWDFTCAQVALDVPECNGAPLNDSCTGANIVASFAADQVVVFGDTKQATPGDGDPLVCCHNGKPEECIGGGSAGDLCDPANNNVDCGSGVCGAGAPIGRNTVWYQFVADTTSASIDTCLSVPPAFDSMLSVFRAGDPTSEATACESLGLIGCNDDGCSATDFSELNSKLCVRDLVIGDTYYVMLSTKRTDLIGNNPAGRYDIRFESPCPDERPLANDFCDFSETITDTNCVDCNPVATDLTSATLQCPAPLAVPGMSSDQWFDYTATCTGTVTASTCGSPFDTSLVVYEGCEICPDFETEPIAFNDDASNDDSFPDCGVGSVNAMLTFDAVAGKCYRVRVGDQGGLGGIGDLDISCSGQCPSGSVTWIDPPFNAVDAGRPWLSSDSNQLLGIETLVVEVVPDGVHGGDPTLPKCWDICDNFPVDGIPVAVQSIAALGGDQYAISLTRPLTHHAVTTVEYLGNNASQDVTRITAHPGNSDGGFSVSPGSDVYTFGELSNMVTRFRFLFPTDPPSFFIDSPLQGEPYSLDIDRSGAVTPLDLLDSVDLMNGAEQYAIENGTAIPSSPVCPN